MSKTITGQFDNDESAQRTVQALVGSGVPAHAIKLVPGENPASGDYGVEGKNQTLELMGIIAVYATLFGLIIGVLVGSGHFNAVPLGLVRPGGTMASAAGLLALGAGLGALAGALIGLVAGIIVQIVNRIIASAGFQGPQVVVKSSDELVDSASSIMQQNRATSISHGSATH